MSKFPLDPRISHAILNAGNQGRFLNEIVIIASMLVIVEQLFVKDATQTFRNYPCQHSSSEHLTLLNIFKEAQGFTL